MRGCRRQWPAGVLPCFYCGVDSTPLKIFLFGIFGFLTLGTVLFGIGMLMRGKFDDPERHKSEVITLEAE
jgi:hypothetical protein